MKKKKIAMIVIGIILLLAIGGGVFLNQPSFGKLPSGERLERIRRSPNFRDGEFQNLVPSPTMTSKKSKWQAMKDFLFADKTGVEPTEPIKAYKTDLKHLPQDKNLMVWFGHSSYLLQIDGRKILVDPVFYNASMVSFVGKPFKGTDIYKPEDMPDIDVLVISHDHWDHLDYKTVKALKDRIGKIVCPLGVGEHFEYWDFDMQKVVEMDWQEDALLFDSITVHCLPARHFSGRGLKPNRTLWASYLLETPSINVFLGGDSGYGPHFKTIGEKYEIDWAILENGQYNEDWRYIHTLPNQLPIEVNELGCDNVVTVHHSKFALARHKWDEPLKNEKLLKEKTTANVVTVDIGQVIELSKSKEYEQDTD